MLIATASYSDVRLCSFLIILYLSSMGENDNRILLTASIASLILLMLLQPHLINILIERNPCTVTMDWVRRVLHTTGHTWPLTWPRHGHTWPLALHDSTGRHAAAGRSNPEHSDVFSVFSRPSNRTFLCHAYRGGLPFAYYTPGTIFGHELYGGISDETGRDIDHVSLRMLN